MLQVNIEYFATPYLSLSRINSELNFYQGIIRVLAVAVVVIAVEVAVEVVIEVVIEVAR